MQDLLPSVFGPIQIVQIVGLNLVVVGGLFIAKGRVPYGWRGRPPIGYITGTWAKLMGVLLLVVGFGCVLGSAGWGEMLVRRV